MMWHGARNKAFALESIVMETLIAMRRAGGNIIFTYFTPQILEWLKK